MSQKSIILAVSLFAILVGGMFTYAHLKQSELQQIVPIEESLDDTAIVDIPYSEITRIDAKHYFVDGNHTLVGEINFPTPCDLLETEAVVMGLYPEQVIIDFTVINNSENCMQSVTSQRFKIEATASTEATFTARFIGREVELNLIPAANGEVPEEFEVFIKG
jgi:hypothetical protein